MLLSRDNTANLLVLVSPASVLSMQATVTGKGSHGPSKITVKTHPTSQHEIHLTMKTFF